MRCPMRTLLLFGIALCTLLPAVPAAACVPPGAIVFDQWYRPVTVMGQTVIGACPSGDWSALDLQMWDMCGNPMAGFEVYLDFADARVCGSPITGFTDMYGYVRLPIKTGLNSSASTSRVTSDYSVIVRGVTVSVGTVSLVSADYNCSQTVDALDFSFFALDWPPAAYATRSDFNDDGAVDALDFSVFALHWLHSN